MEREGEGGREGGRVDLFKMTGKRVQTAWENEKYERRLRERIPLGF
jgi:hypothetical protein